MTLFTSCPFKKDDDRNFGKFDKTIGPLLTWIEALGSKDLGQVITSFSRLHDFYQGIKRDDTWDHRLSLYTHTSTTPLRQYLGNPLDLALALICKMSGRISHHDDPCLLRAYLELAAGSDR